MDAVAAFALGQVKAQVQSKAGAVHVVDSTPTLDVVNILNNILNNKRTNRFSDAPANSQVQKQARQGQ